MFDIFDKIQQSGILDKLQLDEVQTTTWSNHTGQAGGQTVYYRLRDQVPEGIELADYASLIRITWRYQPDAEGLPAPADDARMQALEDLLVEYLEETGRAFMTLAATGNGVRQWHFYTGEADQIMAMLAHQAQNGRQPIETSRDDDPEWAVYREAWKKLGAAAG